MIENMSVKQINELLDGVSECEYEKYINLFKLDSRKSVQNLATKLEKKINNIEKENKRLENMKLYEKEGYKKGYTYIAGVDEVGRGPLAGPVVAAVVVFDKEVDIKYINDSKKLSKAKRESLFDEIIDKALDYGIGIIDNDKIDEVNILNATFLAMKMAIAQLKNKPDYVLVDAVTIPGIKTVQNPIIQGDSKSISIAGASIVAKVTRDKMMDEYDDKYPGYNFKQHKGYGTKEHYEAIEKLGICDIHRRSFLKNLL